MTRATFGGRSATLVLLYLQNNGADHGSGIANRFELAFESRAEAAAEVRGWRESDGGIDPAL